MNKKRWISKLKRYNGIDHRTYYECPACGHWVLIKDGSELPKTCPHCETEMEN